MGIIIYTIISLIVGIGIGFMIFRFVIKSKYNKMMSEAANDAEVLKQKKLLEVKEEFLNKKAQLEKEVQQRNQHILQSENKIKQREMNLAQRQEALTRRKNEMDRQQNNLDAQQSLLVKKQEEIDKMQQMEREKLEAISGLSAEEAKEKLIVSLKDEAQTNAQSYINEIMDDAKMTAAKEAKRIVIQTIQRVATETAIENSVTVFHIDNDEVKGRIIGREAATGV